MVQKRRQVASISSLILFIILGFASNAYSQWVQCNGPDGGYITCFAMQGNGILAGTPDGIYATSDQGDNWNWTFPQLGSIGINDIAISPDGTILAATNGKGVMYSTSQSSTWLQGSGALAYPQRLMVSRSDNYFALESNVYKSTDHGASWHKSGGGLSPISGAICQDSSGVIYAAGYGTFSASTDEGETWWQPQPGLEAAYCYDLQADASGNLFAVTSTFTYRSTDHGQNWTALSVASSSDPVSRLSAQPGVDYAAGYWGFYHSTDNGDTWLSSTLDVTPTAILPITGSTILIGSMGGVLRTPDGGMTWTEAVNGMTNTFIGPVVAKQSGDVFAAVAGQLGGVFHSSDNGNTWAHANLRRANYNPVSVLVALHSGLVFAGTHGSGLFESTNNGGTWYGTSIAGFLPDSIIQCLAVSSTDTMLLGSLHGAFLSMDQGIHWTNVTQSLLDSTIRVVAIDSNGDLIIGTTKTIYASTDLGSHWVDLNGSVASSALSAIAVTKAGDIFVAEYGVGILKGKVSGGVWQNVTAGLPDSAITSITLDQDTLYVTSNNGVHRSTDEGATWTAMNYNLFTNVNSLTVSPNGYRFAGTYGDGVFRSGSLRAGVQTVAPFGTALQTFPNPTAGNTTIQYSNAKSGIAQVTIVNLLGEVVARVFDGELASGEHSFNWAAKGLPDGMYQCVVRTNSRVDEKPILIVR
jgi:photosystem II stability/assembly factor-like uncharacterized protein